MQFSAVIEKLGLPPAVTPTDTSWGRCRCRNQTAVAADSICWRAIASLPKFQASAKLPLTSYSHSIFFSHLATFFCAYYLSSVHRRSVHFSLAAISVRWLYPASHGRFKKLPITQESPCIYRQESDQPCNYRSLSLPFSFRVSPLPLP